MTDVDAEICRHYEVSRFLEREAACLDDFRLSAWLDMLSDDVTYQVPIRTTRARGESASEFSEKGFIFDDGRELLESRVERFEKEYAWAENPQYRTRRFVSNVRVTDTDPLSATDNLALVFSKGDTEPRLLTGEREHRFERTDDGLRLAHRTVHLDHTVTESIPRFL